MSEVGKPFLERLRKGLEKLRSKENGRLKCEMRKSLCLNAENYKRFKGACYSPSYLCDSPTITLSVIVPRGKLVRNHRLGEFGEDQPDEMINDHIETIWIHTSLNTRLELERFRSVIMSKQQIGMS